MTRVLSALALVTLVLSGAAAAGGWPGRPAAPSAQHVVAVAELERQTLVAINDVRRQHGLTALRLNAGLTAAAREHSRSMAEHGFFRHTSYDGSAFWQRIEPVYAPVKGRYWAAGENLAWASPDASPGQAVEMWLRSPPHRRNLLSPAWRAIGLGAVHALSAPGVFRGLDVTILTADFGVRQRLLPRLPSRRKCAALPRRTFGGERALYPVS